MSLDRLFFRYGVYLPVTLARGERFLGYLNAFEKSQWADPAVVRELQERKLNALVEWASTRVPLYRERIDRSRLPKRLTLDDLPALPTLSKADLRDRASELTVDCGEQYDGQDDGRIHWRRRSPSRNPAALRHRSWRRCGAAGDGVAWISAIARRGSGVSRSAARAAFAPGSLISSRTGAGSPPSACRRATWPLTPRRSTRFGPITCTAMCRFWLNTRTIRERGHAAVHAKGHHRDFGSAHAAAPISDRARLWRARLRGIRMRRARQHRARVREGQPPHERREPDRRDRAGRPGPTRR